MSQQPNEQPPAARFLTCAQSRNVDERAIGSYGMSGLVLMENAGRGCADVLCGLGVSGPVLICCGRGNNAGDGFVMARHLDLRGHRVKVLLWGEPDSLRDDAAANYRILAKSDVEIEICGGEVNEVAVSRQLAEADWLVDALLGTGSRGVPRPPLNSVIAAMNAVACRKLAVDLPSGLDCDTGFAADATFRADHTCTFVASKVGFLTESAGPFLGQVHVLDIGIPRKLLHEMLDQGVDASARPGGRGHSAGPDR
jgi:NAD(P)H-hydrate epimerase